MAIVIDNTTIGSGKQVAPSATCAFNTTATVSANGFIVLGIGGFLAAGGGTIVSVAGGGLTWAIDKQGDVATDIFCGVASAQAPAGLTSGTTITVTFGSASTEAEAVGGMSFTGVASSSALDTTSAPTAGSGTAWASASTSILAGSVLVAACMDSTGSLPTSTITSPSIESFDIGDAVGYGVTAGYRIEPSAGSYTVAGTWTVSSDNVTCAAAYKAAAAVAAAPSLRFTKLPKKLMMGRP